MAEEFLWFVGGSLIVLIPGIWLAGALSLGKDRIERWTFGSCLGLALAVYSASLISHFNLSWFYPFWAVVAGVCFGVRIARRRPLPGSSSAWPIITILLLVAITRFGVALPQPLPEGPYDPTVHLILAGKIQQTQHAISDWQPFESVALNYPTGSHTFIVVLAAFTRLPLHTVFKDLIPLLGILSTAQIYLFTRRATADNSIALWAAAAYGLLAWFGSIDYFRWGGLPNEMGMLFFLTMLTLWLDDARRSVRIPIMALVFAAVILVHHHSMLVSGIILLAMLAKPADHFNISSSRAILVGSVAGALLLDLFFLIPYALRITSLHSTTVLYDSEPPLKYLEILSGIGWANAALAVAGIWLFASRRGPKFHPVVWYACAVLAGLFLLTEYFIPLLMKALHKPSAIAFAPSRFLTDLNYFLPIFAAISIAFIQSRFRIKTPWMLALICLAALADFRQWKNLIRPQDSFAPPGFVDACRWIHDHTSPSTVVLNRDNWTTYLTWRRATYAPLPGSDPIPDHAATFRHLSAIVSGQIPPDSPDMTLVKILPVETPASQPVLWSDSTYKVVQIWPTPK